MKKSPLQPKWVNTGISENRLEPIRKHLLNKKVLDIGCAGGFGKPNWFHDQLKKIAQSLTGIDINKHVIDSGRKQGYDLHLADAQAFSLNQKFEVIHAGELIEHLDNFHGFLNSCKDHLTKEGTIILTTPNAMRISNFIYSMFGGLEVNNEHTCWFCDKTITTLLNRNGFEIISLDYIRHTPKSLVRRMLSAILRFILPDNVAWNNLLVIAKVK